MESQQFNTKPGYRRDRLSSGAILGIVVIAFGVVLLLDRFGVLDIREMWRYWPLGLVAAGAAKLAQGCGSGRAWGGFLLIAGILLSIEAFGFPIHLEELWAPFGIIALGVFLLWRALEPPRGRKPDFTGPSVLHEVSIFGGGDRRPSEFAGGELTAVFGGWNLDLRNSQMQGDEAVLEANCIFGGISVRVPQTWEVVVRGAGVFGGYGDRTRHPSLAEVPNPKRLIVRGAAVFGGVDVKN